MHTLLALLSVVVVVVVVVGGDPLYDQADPYSDGIGVTWWPSVRRARDSRPVQPYYQPAVQVYRGGNAYPGGGGGLTVQLAGGADSSFMGMPLDEPSVVDVQKKYPEDLLPRPPIGSQGFPLSFHRRSFPWFFPAPPVLPTFPKGFSRDGGGDFDDFFGTRPSEDRPRPSRYPTPFIPLRIPEPGDFPDIFNNATHEVLHVFGKRVEVNTTTDKKTDGPFTSFVHTQVIHVLPGNSPSEDPEEGNDQTPKKTPKEEDLPPTEAPEEEEHTAKETPADEEVTTNPVATEEEVAVKPTEKPPVEVERETVLPPTFDHAVPAELVHGQGDANAQAVSVMENEVATDKREATKLKMLPYKKYPGASKTKGEGEGKIEGQLSDDTLVNKKGMKPEDPDAEKISDEFL